MYPQMDLNTLGRLVAASETVIISHLWLRDLREKQAAEAGHPAEEAALFQHCAVTKLTGDSSEAEVLSRGFIRNLPS